MPDSFPQQVSKSNLASVRKYDDSEVFIFYNRCESTMRNNMQISRGFTILDL